MKATTFDIESVAVLSLQRGDTLVLKTDEPVTLEWADNLKVALRKQTGFPVCILIVPLDTDLAILRDES